jgi:hypothetical protein
MTLSFRSAGEVECGVTQDKSACVRLATITNGGGDLSRVRSIDGPSRQFFEMACGCWVSARVVNHGFRVTNWCMNGESACDDRRSGVMQAGQI